jgi:hypothetical protein
MAFLNSDLLLVERAGVPYKMAAGELRGLWHPAALDYLDRVATADGQSLEAELCEAINTLFLGLHADGLLPKLEVACLLAGPRTVAGCIEPLLPGVTVNNVNFVAADLTRKGGLYNSGGTKYLDFNHAVPLLDAHLSVYRQTSGVASGLAGLAGHGAGSTKLGDAMALHGPSPYSGRYEAVCSSDVTRAGGNSTGLAGTSAGFYGVARNESANQEAWNPASKRKFAQGTVSGTRPTKMTIFRIGGVSTAMVPAKERLSWFSHGRYVDGSRLGVHIKRYITFINSFLP